MKDNRKILNEAFFKKATYADSLKKKMPQYSPVDMKKASDYSNTTIVPGAAYAVTDTDEVKRRLAGAFGATFGNNNVRSMASRAIKEFPIVISDNVEPETAVMLKKLMEEQYAEYINLLISNQVVNLADYRANEKDGNIAIQALDSISGSNFKSSRIADEMNKTGKLNADTIFQNIPLYNLLRENQLVINTKDELTDTLLENALVIPSEQTKSIVEFLQNNADEITSLNEMPRTRDFDGPPHFREGDDEDEFETSSENLTSSDILNTNAVNDLNRGFMGMGLDDKGNEYEVYSKITTADIVLNKDRLNQAINKTVGEMLMRPENAEIRRKFEKATFLLQSRRIAGVEYYSYLTLRLGIPVSDAARKELIRQFKIGDIRKYGTGVHDLNDSNRGYRISDEEISLIAQNKNKTARVVKEIASPKTKEILAGSGITAVGGIIALAAASPIFSPIIIAAGAGSGFLIAKLMKAIREKREKKLLRSTQNQGWERVEQLINEMDRQQAEANKTVYNPTEVIKNMKPKSYGSDLRTTATDVDFDYDALESHEELKSAQEKIRNTQKDYLKAINDTNKMIAASLTEAMNMINESTTYKPKFEINLDEELFNESIEEISNEYSNDKELMAQLLTERTLARTSMPITTKYVEKKPDKNILVTPTFMARDAYVYGSTEIERRDNKDRRYNQPLIMTIKFKERFDDGKYSDNELTAVIGILGRIIRIPSSEMEYILRENSKGNTVDGILGGLFSTKDSVADLLSGSKVANELKNLPQSADIWKNLEKVSALAMANKMSGKRNGNIANAHIVFSQREIDAVRNDTGVDYLKDAKKALTLMKRYSAFTLMVANDASQRVYIMDDQDNINWNVVPYSALAGKDSGDQLNAAITKMMRL